LKCRFSPQSAPDTFSRGPFEPPLGRGSYDIK
jgi:hypothetical protein